MDYPRAIQQRLTEIGMSQAELARKTGLTAVHINRIVKGHQNPIPLPTLQKIFSALGQKLTVTVDIE